MWQNNKVGLSLSVTTAYAEIYKTVSHVHEWIYIKSIWTFMKADMGHAEHASYSYLHMGYPQLAAKPWSLCQEMKVIQCTSLLKKIPTLTRFKYILLVNLEHKVREKNSTIYIYTLPESCIGDAIFRIF